MEKLARLCVKVISVIYIIVILFLAIDSFFNSNIITNSEHTIFAKNSYIILNVVAVFAITILFVIINKANFKINRKVRNILNILFIIMYAGAFFAFLSVAKIMPNADQQIVLNVSEAFALGRYDDMTGYIDQYPNQIGLVLLYYILRSLPLIKKVFDFVFVQKLNIISLVICFIFISKIVKNFFADNDNRFNIVYLMLFLPIGLYITFVYGTIMGLTLSIISLYLEMIYMKCNKKRYIIFSAIFATLAILIKNNYLIFLIAQIIVILIYTLRFKKLKYMLCIVCYLAMYVIGNFIVAISAENITGVELSDGTPKICWITMGLQENEKRAAGWYNRYNSDTYLQNDRNTQAAEQVATNDFKARLKEMEKNPKNTLKFFYEKISSQWNEPTFESVWIMTKCIDMSQTEIKSEKISEFVTQTGTLYNIYYKYCDIIHFVILFGTFVYSILNFKNFNYNNISFALIFLGGFAFHIFWEAKSQYTLPYFVLIIPYAVLGYDMLAKRILNFKNKKEHRLMLNAGK